MALPTTRDLGSASACRSTRSAATRIRVTLVGAGVGAAVGVGEPLGAATAAGDEVVGVAVEDAFGDTPQPIRSSPSRTAASRLIGILARIVTDPRRAARGFLSE